MRVVTGGVILLAWLASGADGAVTHDYHVFDLATPVMTIYAGFLFGQTVIRRRNGNGT